MVLNYLIILLGEIRNIYMQLSASTV